MVGVKWGAKKESKKPRRRVVRNAVSKPCRDGRMYMYTMGREGNPCNLKKHKNPVPILKPSPSSLWGFSPDPRFSKRCSPMPPRP